MQRQGIKKGIYLLPNIITTANMFCGFFAIIRTINGDYVTAAWVLMLAGVFDLLDGRVARMTKTQSGFGLEYDSLVDLTSFALAPALLAYKWSLYEFYKVGWVACFVYFACGALRLARFNVQSTSVEKKHFQGLPSPGAASTIVTAVVFNQYMNGDVPPPGYFILGLTVLVGLLMVSNIPYRGLKVLEFNRRAHFFVMVLVVLVLFVIAVEPQVTLFTLSMLYVSFGLLKGMFLGVKKIRSFADFMKHFFQADPHELVIADKEKNKGQLLKVVDKE
ncbi:MAG: CDP-diacylglycerol--serine O-phosphatidyltransferase [Deltaproteobacteria bacterium GWA2_45_12]|nr:MAG: CDP-diacylglycerol--serine O-phosphatidyltransferase [Deltaproteobacteria bacterium GWA2_45_12]